MNLEEKIKSMSASEIIMAMVKGLRHKWVAVDMGTFGRRGLFQCFGCAATNAVCEIYGARIPRRFIKSDSHAAFFKCSEKFLDAFENAIDALRQNDIPMYNAWAEECGFASIKEPEFELRQLTTSNYLYFLEPYERLAEMQK